MTTLGASSPDSYCRYLILGAGLAGLSAAYHLRDNSVVAEAEPRPGGTSGSLSYKGFCLDRGVHILYFRDPWTRPFLEKELRIPLSRQQRRSAVWYCDTLVPFPLQFHLASLPLRELIKATPSSLRAALRFSSRSGGAKVSMHDWGRFHLGSRLNDLFFKPYNEKLWGVPLTEMTTEWMDGYFPIASPREVLRGLLSNRNLQIGGNSEFWYPRVGGCASIAHRLAELVGEVFYSMKLISLDLDRNRATFSNGRVLSYEHLISTIPLDLLIGTIELSKTSLPVTQRSLRANPLTLAHILIPRENVGDGLHWIYVPQPEIPFYRITFPQNIGPTTCPVGWSALTLEIGGEVFDKPKVESKCMSALLKLGLLMHHELGVEVVWDFLRHGYITHDRNLMGSRSNILGYLRDKGVVCIGRYGRWEYSNMEAALIQGREIRKRLAVYNENKKSRLALPATATNSSVRNYFARYYPDRYSKLAGLTFRRGESDRLDCIRKWVPHTEALTILDAGCGDGNFLAEVMHGKAAKVRLEDFVSANVELAKRRIQFKADIVETATADLKGSGDGSTYDLVLAIGIFDYEHDWELLFSRLLSRCRGMLIADFPKSGTFHQRLRKIWLRRQGIVLESCCRSHLEDLFAQWRLKSDIADLPLQWMTKIDMRKEWE